MTSEHWQQVEEIFHQALQREPAAREAYVREACRDDSDLRREVVSLLANHNESDALAPASTLIPGQSLGPFRIDSFLAAGGMGEVYRATDTRLNRTVAIKISAARFSERFEREARAIASLNHPKICQLYDVGPNYLVMEFVDGAPLKGPLPVGKAIEYARQILDALDAAHRKGITHRDLKPANILLIKAGVKLLDFGLAKHAPVRTAMGEANETETMAIGLTHEGAIVGTPQYMSPEQVEGKEADARSDIFSFGAVLYELITGKKAFEGKTAASVMAAVLRQTPASMATVVPVTPLPLDRLVHRCLEKDPDDRWQTARDAKHALEDLRLSEPAVNAAIPRARWWWGVSTVLAVALATTALFLFRATRPIPQPLVRISSELTAGPDSKSWRLDPDTIIMKPAPGTSLAVSPDGTRIATSVRDADGKTRLATRQLDQSRFVPLPGTDNAGSPFFSPDSQWVAFFAEGKLKKIAIQGGAPVTLCDAGLFASGSWGDDGNIIAELDPRGALSRIPSAGGAPPTPVTQLDQQKREQAHLFPQVLPGSHAVLFTSTGFAGPDDYNIDVLSLDTHERKTVVRGGNLGRYLPSGHLVYLHQNQLIAAPFNLSKLMVTGGSHVLLDNVSSITPSSPGDFDFSRTGTFVYISGSADSPRSIFRMDRAGKTQPLHTAPGFYNSLRFSPDGKHLAFVAATDTWSIWVEDVERDTTVRLTPMPGSNGTPIWTPDGRHIVFWSHNQANPGVYWIRADGSGNPQRLFEQRTADSQSGLPSSFSLDGKRLAMYDVGGRGFAANIWTESVEGDPDHPSVGRRVPFLRTSGSAVVAFAAPVLSPDGHWMAYALAETGRSEIYVQPFPGPGGKLRISNEGGAFPIWSPNGRELFFLSLEPRIMVVDYTSKGDSFAPGKPRLWSEKRILFREGGGPFPPYDIAPDGKRFAVLLYPDGTAEHQRTIQLTFLLNFFDELRRRVPTGGK